MAKWLDALVSKTSGVILMWVRLPLWLQNGSMAQLVRRNRLKPCTTVGSTPTRATKWSLGGIGRHAGFKHQCPTA